MQHHHHHHPGHAHPELAAPTDERFPEDEFTRAALLERQQRIAHTHAKHAFLALLGGFVVFGIVGKLFGRCR